MNQRNFGSAELGTAEQMRTEKKILCTDDCDFWYSREQRVFYRSKGKRRTMGHRAKNVLRSERIVGQSVLRAREQRAYYG